PILTCRQREQDELLAAEFGRDAHWHLSLDAARRLHSKPGSRADHGRDETMERENCRCRKSRQYGERLPFGDGEAKRLTGLERHAMDENLAQLRNDAMG